MDEKRKLQWEILMYSKEKLVEWSLENDIKLHTTHYIVPFVETDFAIHVIFFYEDNNDLKEYQKSGSTSDLVKQTFVEILNSKRYREHFKDEITFEFDTHENVINNYEGNYFYRLR